jgi:hypothetical protein
MGTGAGPQPHAWFSTHVVSSVSSSSGRTRRSAQGGQSASARVRVLPVILCAERVGVTLAASSCCFTSAVVLLLVSRENGCKCWVTEVMP